MKNLFVHSPLLVRVLITLAIVAGGVAVVYFATGAAGAVDSATTVSAPLDAKTNNREIDNVAFGVGEKLFYDINYGFINAGTASMEIADLIEYEGRPCYQIVTHANSNGFFSKFYKVEDRVESIVDAIGIYAWRFEKNLREGTYRADRQYTFDQIGHVVHYDKDTIPVEPFVHDALSALYFVRTQPLEVGTSLYLDNFVDGKKYKLEVRVHRKERIKVAAGTFDCVVVEPLSQAVGVFKHEGTLTVWLTDDRLRLPVLMKSRIVVGSVSAELTDYKLGEIRNF